MKPSGFFPCSQVILAHLPHSIDVLTGSSKVVSILNMGLPASGISVATGSHSSAISADFSLLFPIEIPQISSITPPIERGAESAMENEDPSLRVRPEPRAMQNHAEMMVFSWRFEAPDIAPMHVRLHSGISALVRIPPMWRVQVMNVIARSKPQ